MLFIQHNTESMQINWLDSRAYSNNNVDFYPGVTTILGIIDKGTNFQEWLKNNGRNADWITKTAMENGSSTHELIQDFNTDSERIVTYMGVEPATGMPVERYNQKVWSMFANYVEFYKKARPRIVGVEHVLCSPERGYGGQIDLVCYMRLKPTQVKDKWTIMPCEEEILWLIDHKTGNIYQESELQTAAYAVMWNDFFPDMKIQATAVLELDASTRTEGSKGTVQGHGWALRLHGGNYREYMKEFTIFKGVHQTWRWRNKTWRPFFAIYPDHFIRKEIDDAQIDKVTEKKESDTQNYESV